MDSNAIPNASGNCPDPVIAVCNCVNRANVYLCAAVGEEYTGSTDEELAVYIISQDTGFDSIVDFWRGRNIEAFRQPSIASPSTPKDVSLKKGTSTKKKKKKSDHVSKESKKDAKEITEKKKPEKKKLPEAIRKKIRTELKDEKLPAGKYTSIYKAVEESENKLALNNALVKTFDTSIGSRIYNHIKKIYEDYQR